VQDLTKPPNDHLDRRLPPLYLASIGALVAVVPPLIVYLDASIKTFILSVQGDLGMAVALWVSAIGHGLLNAAFAVALLAVGLAMRRPREAMVGRVGLFAVIAGGLSVQLLKHLFCRARPLAQSAGRFFAAFPCLSEGPELTSFPSGHAVTAFAMAYVLSQTYPRASLVLYALATMVGLSRVFLGSHFASDVAAGAAIGLLTGYIVCRLARFPLRDGRA
jgi:membrane-associated phospholipid phosphatase